MNEPHLKTPVAANERAAGDDIKTGRVAPLAIVALVALWAYAVSQIGFAAFIYPLLALVLAAFVFTLSLTCG